jgi:hypothetical protein
VRAFLGASGLVRLGALAAFAAFLPWGWWIAGLGVLDVPMIGGVLLAVLVVLPGVAILIWPSAALLSLVLRATRSERPGRLVASWACYGSLVGCLWRILSPYPIRSGA